MRKLLSFLLIAFFATVLHGQTPQFLVRQFPRKVHVTYTVHPKAAQRASFKQLLVLPVPRTDEKREIENLEIHLPPGITAEVKSFPETGDLYLPVLTTGSLQTDIVIEYDAVVYTIHYNLPSGSSIRPYDTTSDLYKMYTTTDTRVEPNHPRIVEIANRIWKESSDVIDYAHRVYYYEQANLKWKNTGRYKTITEIFANGGGDCGALTAVYISLLRNKGVPARQHAGGVLREGDGWDWHVWPEFYLEGYGWVETDPSFFTSAPGFFAIDDGMRIHFNRSGVVTVDYEDFHFQTRGIQTYSIYRRGIADVPVSNSNTSNDALDYDLKMDVRTISVSNDDDLMNSDEFSVKMTQGMMEQIIARRKRAGLETEMDPQLNTLLSQAMADDVNHVSHRPQARDCRSGCLDEPVVRSRGGSTMEQYLKEYNYSFSGYYYEETGMWFTTLNPVPYAVERFDQKRMLDRSWNTIGAGYFFDMSSKTYHFRLLYGVRNTRPTF